LLEEIFRKKWAAIARRLISELRSGEVKAVPGEEVFSRIWKAI
jgi:hypothetical protein